MPLVRISLPAGQSATYRRQVADAVHQALVAAIGIPADDRFQILSDSETRIYDRNYLGVARSDHTIFIQITLVRGRALDKKLALYAGIVDQLARAPGVRREDVVITLLENGREDWSVGNGEAQLVQS
jgi:phenylpyruvate tautomerase PptA (4-oxalocrotonate tautomerase family)